MSPQTYDPNSPNEQEVTLPSAPLQILSDDEVLQPPLTRRGIGPGIILFLPPLDVLNPRTTGEKPLDPEPVQKWAEEGYAVFGLIPKLKGWSPEESLKKGAAALLALKELDTRDKFGVVGRITTLDLTFILIFIDVHLQFMTLNLLSRSHLLSRPTLALCAWSFMARQLRPLHRLFLHCSTLVQDLLRLTSQSLIQPLLAHIPPTLLTSYFPKWPNMIQEMRLFHIAVPWCSYGSGSVALCLTWRLYGTSTHILNSSIEVLQRPWEPWWSVCSSSQWLSSKPLINSGGTVR